MNTLGLKAEQSIWSYQIQGTGDKLRILSLNCRIPIADIQSENRLLVESCVQEACRTTGVSVEVSNILKSAVFEVRQGYKSKDLKRQNANRTIA